MIVAKVNFNTIEILQQSKLRTMIHSKVERRKFTRVPVLADEFFIFCHETKRMTAVMDISMGGLKIECYPSAESRPDVMTIDIYALPQSRFHMAGIPCRVVYDIANLKEDSTFSGSQSRISGLRYEKFTDEQRDKLAYFLNFMNPDLSSFTVITKQES
jgi:hypothetical protein